ncbi:GNAT family N-acetyltransferase [Paenibacillus sp. sgz500958]|uniref:GNAT family N-acetyltransferase n=1 Tax=Paenibacillus sp. sgz500958 TaxID=3242475 RepID=UPI0036D2BC6F
MEIKILESFSREDQQTLGSFGYTSSSKYQVKKDENLESISIEIQRIPLESPYIKLYPEEPEDLERYDRILPLGFSLGGYLNNQLIAAAIGEPVYWNNTLLIWTFQVAEKHRRMNVGTTLMQRVLELARVKGFRAVVVETQNTNEPAIDFYKKCGFEIDGIDLSYYTNNDMDEGEIAFFMKKKIEV